VRARRPGWNRGGSFAGGCVAAGVIRGGASRCRLVDPQFRAVALGPDQVRADGVVAVACSDALSAGREAE